MVTAAERPLALTPAFLAGLSAWTWIDSTPEGLVAFLLVAHPGGAEDDMTALAGTLGVATPDRTMPELAPALTCTTDGVVLDLPGAAVNLRVPAAADWLRFVASGAPVVLLVSGAPLSRDADLQAVSGHLLSALLPGRVWMGKTHAR